MSGMTSTSPHGWVHGVSWQGRIDAEAGTEPPKNEGFPYYQHGQDGITSAPGVPRAVRRRPACRRWRNDWAGQSPGGAADPRAASHAGGRGADSRAPAADATATD